MYAINKIEAWKPTSFIPTEFLDLHSIMFSSDILEVKLLYNGGYILFKFPNMIQGRGSYKCTSLNFNLRFNDELGKWMKCCNLKEQAYPLFVAKDSGYIKEMKEQSYSVLTKEYEKMKHYIIISVDTVIEVICCEVPEVVLIPC